MSEQKQSSEHEPSAYQIYMDQQQYVAQGLITHEETLRQFNERCIAQWHAAQQQPVQA